VCCCYWWVLTLWTLCLNTEWVISISHSWLKHLNCWLKDMKNLIHYSWIFNAQLHDHLKKWTLKFKLLYLRYHISYFNKIRRICCANICIQSISLVQIHTTVAKIHFFLRYCFLLAHPVYTLYLKKTTLMFFIVVSRNHYHYHHLHWPFLDESVSTGSSLVSSCTCCWVEHLAHWFLQAMIHSFTHSLSSSVSSTVNNAQWISDDNTGHKW